MCACVHMCTLEYTPIPYMEVPMETRRACRMPWDWIYRQWWTMQHGWWDSDSGLFGWEHCALNHWDSPQTLLSQVRQCRWSQVTCHRELTQKVASWLGGLRNEEWWVDKGSLKTSDFYAAGWIKRVCGFTQQPRKTLVCHVCTRIFFFFLAEFVGIVEEWSDFREWHILYILTGGINPLVCQL